MILITGAAGKTGRAVITALARKGAQVRAFARSADTAAILRGLGASDVVVGTFDDEAAVASAVESCRVVYHIAPNVDEGETRYAAALIAAAEGAGVSRFVYHSVLHPQIEAMPHHWAKMRVEEALFASKLPFTILQPTAYMQNLLGAVDRARAERVYVTPYPVETRLSLVDLADVAEAAARVLTEEGHAGATYELVGSPPLDQAEAACALSSALGFPVEARAQTLEEWEAGARASGLSDHARQALVKMFRAYSEQGLVGNSNILRWLIGREPTSLESMLRRALARE